MVIHRQYSLLLLKVTPKVEIIGIPDKFVEHGTPEELYKICGMDKESVLAALLKFKEIKG